MTKQQFWRWVVKAVAKNPQRYKIRPLHGANYWEGVCPVSAAANCKLGYDQYTSEISNPAEALGMDYDFAHVVANVADRGKGAPEIRKKLVAAIREGKARAKKAGAK